MDGKLAVSRSKVAPAPSAGAISMDMVSATHAVSGSIVSVRTVIVGVFVVLVAVLGACIIAISATSATKANSFQRDGTEQIRTSLVLLTSDSNTVLLNQGRDSVDYLVRVVMLQVNARIGAAIGQFTQWSQFSNELLADAWRRNKLDETDLDKTIDYMWAHFLQFGDVSYLDFAVAATGDFVGLERFTDGRYGVELRNTSAKCNICEPGALGTNKYYYYATPFVYNNLTYRQNKAYDPRVRGWYLKSLEGNGEGRWTDVFTFSSGTSVGLTAVKMVFKNNVFVGVVGADIVLDYVGLLLKQVRSELGGNGHIAILDRKGNMIGTSSTDAIAVNAVQLHWSVAINNTILRQGLKAISDYWAGNFSRITPTAGNNQIYRTATGLVAMTTLFQDRWGLNWIVVNVVPLADYTSNIDASLRQVVSSLEERKQETEVFVSDIDRQVNRDFEHNNAVTIGVSVAILVSGTLLMLALTFKITEPLHRLGEDMSRVAMFEFVEDGGKTNSGFHEVAAINKSFHLMTLNLRSFARYVPEDVVRMLAAKQTDARLGVKPRDVTIFFSDIVGFTTIAEKLDPDTFMDLLAEYLGAMSAVIMRSGGTIGEFIGDAVMAFWNSPNEVHSHPAVACAAALEQQRTLAALREKWLKQGLPEVRARMGINTGNVLHGNIGSQNRMKWGLVGDNVNLASRLESMAKQYGVNILVSGAVVEAAGTKFLFRVVDRVVAVGKTAATDIFELVANEEDATPQQRAYCADFDAVVVAFRDRRFEEARTLATAYEQRYPGDATALLYIERCDIFVASPPPEGWNGAWVLTSK